MCRNISNIVPDHYPLTMPHWLAVLLFVIGSSTCISEIHAQARTGHQNVSPQTSAMDDPHGGHASSSWESSAQGVAYSEFNHRFAESVGVTILHGRLH